MREQLIDRLRETVAGWEQSPRVVLLFGSAARAQATTSSDLDLLVVRCRDCDPDSEPWQAQLSALQRSATAWTGNDTRVLEYGEDELTGGPAEPVLEDALRDGIELYGSRRTLRRLIGSQATR